MEVGIDIEHISRFEDKSDEFLHRIFAREEIEYAKKFKNAAENFCAFWCVKEAVIKAFSNRALPLVEICTLHDENGKPYIFLNETIKNELAKNDASEIKISISHSKELATAICIIK